MPSHQERVRAKNPERLMLPDPLPRYFECFFNFLGWHQWSLGFHIDPQHPHIDIHVPTGFLRIGWHCDAVSFRRMEPDRRPRHIQIW